MSCRSASAAAAQVADAPRGLDQLGQRLTGSPARPGSVTRRTHCVTCGTVISVTDLVVTPGSGLTPAGPEDGITAALAGPHCLLDPIRA